jgi:hypothetical protein
VQVSPCALFATQRPIRKIIPFVCAGMYLYSAALGVVVGLKESSRHGAGLESPGVEDLHDPGYVPPRIHLPHTPLNKGKERKGRTESSSRGLQHAG